MDLQNVCSHSFTLCVTDFNLLELAKLLDCTSEMHDVLAAFAEGIKTHKESVCGDLPLVLGLALVVKVGIFEFGANIESKGQFLVSIMRLLIFDGLKNLTAVDCGSALLDDSVANLSYQDDKA